LPLCHFITPDFFPAQHATAQIPGFLFNDAVHEIRIYFLSLLLDSLVNHKAYDDAYDTSTFIPSLTMVDGTVLDSTGVQLRGHSSYDYYPGIKNHFNFHSINTMAHKNSMG